MAAGPIAYGTAIVGGGVSGSSVLLALARRAKPGYRAALFEPGRPGPGTAYGTPHHALLMNGGAGSMSLAPDDKRDLLRFLESDAPHELIPRRVYGEYAARAVDAVLGARPSFEHVAARVVDIEPVSSGYALTDERERRFFAENVVLALGNFPPDDAFLPDAVRAYPGYHRDPWRFDPAGIAGDVAIVGSRLTAMDVVALLDERGFRGGISLISRHGFTPALEDPSVDGLDARSLGLQTETPLRLLRSLRRAAADHVRAGGDWRAVVEALRPVTPAIWLGWNVRERRRFLRHVHALWAAHRYRVPAATHAAWQRRLADGQARIVQGRIVDAACIPEENSLQMTVANAAEERRLCVRAVVNATGPGTEYARIDDALVRNLLRRGLVRPDELHLGLDATAAYRAVSREGAAQPNLLTLGPPMRGILYETTAVPEIVRAARDIAASLCTEAAVLGAAS